MACHPGDTIGMHKHGNTLQAARARRFDSPSTGTLTCAPFMVVCPNQQTWKGNPVPRPARSTRSCPRNC